MVRKAALVGAAFGVGYQVSKWARSGRIPPVAVVVKDIYRTANEGDLSSHGRITEGWIQESLTVISAVYGFLGRDGNSSER